jgi:hypothetical protein
MTDLSSLSPSEQTAAKTIFAAFKVLKKAGGELPGREVVKQVVKYPVYGEGCLRL